MLQDDIALRWLRRRVSRGAARGRVEWWVLDDDDEGAEPRLVAVKE